MPRQERPLESEETPLLRFAGDLRRLRRRAGLPTYRELGKRTNYSAAALSEAVSGRRLPSLAVTVAFVRACDGDVGEWTDRWRELAAAQPGSGGETPVPYVGLAAYQIGDADRFFGREALTDTLLALVDERPFVGVFGASGAGKSSLLRAGLVARGGRTALVVTPGDDPATELAVSVAGLIDEPPARVRDDLASGPEALRGWLLKAPGDVLLVVDQLEEVFTLCDEATQRWLVRALTTAAGSRIRVVVGVRADFYGHCARHPELVAALHRAQVLVGPMSTEELRSAFTGPAARAGVSLETALVARVVSDVAGHPAALPLASHALAETWRRRRGMTLTLVGYQEVGGIEHALARTAERTFGALAEDDQAAARRLLLRLVVPGEGTEDTKRRVRRSDLDVPDALLNRLAEVRLITIDAECVDLTHEALLWAWPRLAGWIAQGRDDLRDQHRFAEATAVWEAHGRDPDTLYRGARLEQSVRLRDRLNPRERAFLDAGLAAEQARSAAGRRASRRLHRLTAGLAALTVLLAATTVGVVVAQRAAARQRNEALSVRAADAARELLTTRPRDAAALALAAHRLAPTGEADGMLLLAHGAAGASSLGGGYVTTPGRIAVTVGAGTGDDARTERLWRSVGGSWRLAATLPVGRGFFLALVSVEERRLLYRSGEVSRLWDVSDPDHPRVIAVPADLAGIDSMDATGSVTAAIDADGRAVVWREGDRSVRRLPATGVEGTAVLEDGSGVLLSRLEGDRHIVERWTLAGTRAATLLNAGVRLQPYAGPGGLVATVSGAGDVTVLNAADPDHPRTVAEAAGLDYPATVAFDRGGRTVAVVAPGTARLWDVTAGASVLSVRTQGLGFGFPRVRGHELTVLDGNARIWRLNGDLAAVIRETCGTPLAVDWDRYFPGTTRRRLCP